VLNILHKKIVMLKKKAKSLLKVFFLGTISWGCPCQAEVETQKKSSQATLDRLKEKNERSLLAQGDIFKSKLVVEYDKVRIEALTQGAQIFLLHCIISEYRIQRAH